ncbi:microtubule-binding protein TANGLED isoform X1 [Pistacia vera]|uniref:microtubule-binding protein TANGLED isoform X1 n=2 Tax=Pistacia vera TaxID=55513 RepID=UPI001263980A|nr:microtubule-binding protein TANGLED isoform X1 [Pistacia vera]
MVARTPPKQRRVMAPLNPNLIRETVKKVDKCMARLQELQYTVAGGNKMISGVSLSPRSTRGYLKASLRCKQESLRIKNAAAPRRSPGGKLPESAGGEWRRMSLPAMLLGETMGEILQASLFAKEIVAAVANKTKKITIEDPKTPVTQKRNQRPNPENSELKVRRKKEKQNKLQSIRSESRSPTLQRARSRINFKVSPPKVREFDKENNRYLANRVSPRNRLFAKKTVLFPNPLFLSTPSQQQKFCKTRSPVVARNKQSPHKFLIKSPPSTSKFQVKIKSPAVVSLSPTRPANLSKKKSPQPKLSTASKFRRSFSPSRLANRLVSPLKSRKSVQKCDGQTSGLKQRPPTSIPMRFSTGRF